MTLSMSSALRAGKGRFSPRRSTTTIVSSCDGSTATSAALSAPASLPTTIRTTKLPFPGLVGLTSTRVEGNACLTASAILAARVLNAPHDLQASMTTLLLCCVLPPSGPRTEVKVGGDAGAATGFVGGTGVVRRRRLWWFGVGGFDCRAAVERCGGGAFLLALLTALVVWRLGRALALVEPAIFSLARSNGVSKKQTNERTNERTNEPTCLSGSVTLAGWLAGWLCLTASLASAVSQSEAKQGRGEEV